MPSITDVKAHLSFIFKFQLSFIKFPFLILPYTTKRHTLVRLNLQFLSKRLQFIFESIVKTPSSQPSFMSQSAIHKWSLLSRATHIKLSCFLKLLQIPLTMPFHRTFREKPLSRTMECSNGSSESPAKLYFDAAN